MAFMKNRIKYLDKIHLKWYSWAIHIPVSLIEWMLLIDSNEFSCKTLLLLH